MREVIRNLILGFFIFISLFAIFYYFQKGIARRALLAEISGFFQREENFEKEILVLKEKINSLEENLQNALTQIQTLKGRENDSQKMSEIIKRTERKVENLTKKSESLVKEVLKNPKICQNFDSKEKLESVIFNEICWMGSEDSPADEWIELKNISQKEIDLSGWQILNKNQKIKIIFEQGTKILPGRFLVLERGDDFTGAIKNSNEGLFLFDENCVLQDKVLADPNWPAGDNKEKKTMERKLDFSWQTSENRGGTPAKENSKGLKVEKEVKEKVKEERKEKTEPKIILDFPKTISAGKEFEVLFSVSNLKFDQYDVKISILKISDESEQKRTISEISLTGEEWQDSYKYLTKVFRGDSFSGKFKIRVDPEFSGLAEILAKIRKSANKSLIAEFKDKIEVQKTERIVQQIIQTSPPLQTSSTSQIKETQSSQTAETQSSQTGGQQEQIFQPSTSNLLLNPSFETNTGSAEGQSFSYWKEIGTVGKIEPSTTFVRTEDWAAKFTDLTSAYSGRGLLSDLISVIPGQVYSFGAWFYLPAKPISATSSEVRIRVQIKWYDLIENLIKEEPTVGKELSTYDKWEEITLSYVAPESAVKARLEITAHEEVNRKHDLYIDDAYIIKQ